MSEERATERRGPATSIGRRVVVTGLAGAGKSTFSKALASKTGLPLVHLDLEFWKPGWTAPSEEEWREKQREVLAGDFHKFRSKHEARVFLDGLELGRPAP
jgi:dephospho-CoA kinase